MRTHGVAQRVRDLAAAIFIWSSAAIVFGAFVWLLWQVVRDGAGRVDWEFLTTQPQRAGREGGIAPIIVSTAWILLVSMASAIPLGLGSAVFLAEIARRGARTGRLIERSLDVLASIPSIVFGLFGNAFFCSFLGMGFSIASGGLTLACMALPLIVRIATEGLRATPLELRQAAAAVGLSRTSTLLWVVLPHALPSLAAGVVLGFGRAAAETAALIFTSGYVDRMPRSVWDSGRALSVHIYDLSMNVPGGDESAAASALVLILAVLAINSLASWIVRRPFRQRGRA